MIAINCDDFRALDCSLKTKLWPELLQCRYRRPTHLQLTQGRSTWHGDYNHWADIHEENIVQLYWCFPLDCAALFMISP